jgi:HEAT repeat protein
VVLLALALLQDVDVLLRGLGDEDLAVRERSAAALLERWERWSDADLAALRKGAESPDREIAGRVKSVLASIGRKRRLGADLLAKVPDLERSIASGTVEDRAALLVEVRRRWRLGDVDSPQARAVAELLTEAGYVMPEDAELLDDPFRPYAPLLGPLAKDPARREEAVDRISMLEAREFAPVLLSLRDHPSEGVRVRAARALAEWGRPEGRDLALTLLGSADPIVLDYALEALQRLPSGVPAAKIAPLLNRDEELLRCRVLRLLGKVGGKDVVPQVAAFLRDKSASVRGDAAAALSDLGAKEWAPAILALLPGAGRGEEYVVQEALAELGLEPLREAITAMSERDDESGRWRAWELRLQLDPDAPRKDLAHEKADRRAWAARAMGWQRRPADAPAFATLLKDPSADVREAAIEGLAGARATDRAEAVAALLADPDKRVRMTAADVLGRLDGRAFAGRLVPLLQDPEDWPRFAALRSLGWLGTSEHAGTILDFMKRDPERDPDAALMALVDLGATDRIQAVRDLLKKDPLNKQGPVRALAALGGTVEELVPYLNDDDVAVVRPVVEALAPTASDAVVRTFEAMADGPHAFEAARGLLDTGRADAFTSALRIYARPDLGQERLWLAWALAAWTARGVEPPDRAAFVRMLDRMEEEVNDSFRDAALLAKVGLGLVPPARFAEAFGRCGQEESAFHVFSSVHLKGAYPKLFLPFVLEKDVVSARDVEVELARQWGLKVRVDDTLFFTGRVPKGRRASGQALIDRLSHRYVERRAVITGVGTFVDGDVLRVGLWGDAGDFWRKQLGMK